MPLISKVYWKVETSNGLTLAAGVITRRNRKANIIDDAANVAAYAALVAGVDPEQRAFVRIARPNARKIRVVMRDTPLTAGQLAYTAHYVQ